MSFGLIFPTWEHYVNRLSKLKNHIQEEDENPSAIVQTFDSQCLNDLMDYILHLHHTGAQSQRRCHFKLWNIFNHHFGCHSHYQFIGIASTTVKFRELTNV